MELIRKISLALQSNITRSYLILGNVVLVVFAIWFSNVGVLPFKNTGDFALFVFLGLILALYRPGWTFVLFVGALALENVNLAPGGLGLMLRPYQFFGALTIISLIVQIVMKRLPFSLPKFMWFDALPAVFALGGFLSSLGAASRGASFKQAVVAASFVALYFLVRVYVQSLEDLKRVAPFFLSSAVVVAAYGIWQNARFISGRNAFEVMAGRPNATFTEPDWFGIYLVFMLAVICSVIYFFEKKAINGGKNIVAHVSSYLFFMFVSVAMLLTVSRSAWLGAVFVTIGFLKIMLTGGSWKYGDWDWRNFSKALLHVVIAAVLSIAIVYVFGLTRFQLFNRAASTGGLQKITIACEPGHPSVPQSIGNVSELGKYGCRHINLEDINKEKVQGNDVLEVFRPDPNVNIRSQIYEKSIEQIRQNPLFGIGWGSISRILGTDERGAGLNASDIFLEVWLGAGILGILSFVILLGYIFFRGVRILTDSETGDKTVTAFVLLGFTAVVVPNLFNSGIFLGFLWAYLAAASSLSLSKN